MTPTQEQVDDWTLDTLAVIDEARCETEYLLRTCRRALSEESVRSFANLVDAANYATCDWGPPFAARACTPAFTVVGYLSDNGEPFVEVAKARAKRWALGTCFIIGGVV